MGDPFAIRNTEPHWDRLRLLAMSLADRGHSQGRLRCCFNSWNWDEENSYILDATAFLTKRQHTDYCNPIEHFRKAERQVTKKGQVKGYFHQCQHSNCQKLSGMCLVSFKIDSVISLIGYWGSRVLGRHHQSWTVDEDWWQIWAAC